MWEEGVTAAGKECYVECVKKQCVNAQQSTNYNQPYQPNKINHEKKNQLKSTLQGKQLKSDYSWNCWFIQNPNEKKNVSTMGEEK